MQCSPPSATEQAAGRRDAGLSFNLQRCPAASRRAGPLATCQEITYRLHADALGIPLDDVSVKLEGERLKRVVDVHCPVLDLFSNATPVVA